MTNFSLLFTCPHGGKKDGTTDNPPLDPPLIERNGNNLPGNICRPQDGQEFNVIRDSLRIELTESLVNNIERLSQGRTPHKQIADYDRKFIDFNRNERCSCEELSSMGNTKYKNYHEVISQKNRRNASSGYQC
jgi:hypothetical protein